MLRLVLITALASLAAACSRSYPLPPQCRTYAGPEAQTLASYVHLSDLHAHLYLVNGFLEGPEGDRWRWTRRRPEMRFQVPAGPSRFVMRFFIADQTLRENGPVTVSVSIDGRTLGSIRCDAAREFVFEKDVPEAWLRRDRPVTVAAEVDKPWVSRVDGAELGILMVSAGFSPR